MPAGTEMKNDGGFSSRVMVAVYICQVLWILKMNCVFLQIKSVECDECVP